MTTENEQIRLNNQRVEELIDTIRTLRKEVYILESRVQEHATGHIITAIGVINGRIDEMVQELTAPFFEDEDRCPYSNAPDPDAINFDIPKEGIYGGGRPLPPLDEDVYDGYKEHIESKTNEDDSDDYDTFDSLPG